MNKVFLDFINHPADIEGRKDNYKLYSSEYDTVKSVYIKQELMSKERFLEVMIDAIRLDINTKFSMYDSGINIDTYTLSRYFKDEIDHEQYMEYVAEIYNEIIRVFDKNVICKENNITKVKRTSFKTFLLNIFNIYCLKNNLDFDRFYMEQVMDIIVKMLILSGMEMMRATNVKHHLGIILENIIYHKWKNK